MIKDRHKTIFGFAVSPDTAQAVVARLTNAPREANTGPGLIVTPNTDHILKLRSDAAFALAYRRAEIIVCDGFPVYYYARARGLTVPARVTGYELADQLMHNAEIKPWQRLFFTVDSAATQKGLEIWAASRGLQTQIAYAVCPPDFDSNATFAMALAEQMRAHRTTILLMGVGAPRSEVFASHYRDSLPPCWVLCVGQALRVQAGLSKRAPRLWQALNLEWLWRIALEPRRLTMRYVRSSFGFLVAVAEDLAHRQDAR